MRQLSPPPVPALRVLPVLAVLAAACSTTTSGPVVPFVPGADGGAVTVDTVEAEDPNLPPVDMTGPIGGARPVTVRTPTGFDPAKKYPLVILLHGYSAGGAIQDAYLGMSKEADRRGFVFAAPDGTPDPQGKRFWNASDACCNLYGAEQDDVVYLRDLVRQIVSRYSIDKRRVYLFGHSNGGFMSHRLACEESKRFAGIASLAGAAWSDDARCKPEVPVAVLQIHGTVDNTIAYAGGVIRQATPGGGSAKYPSAEETVAGWARRNGCAAEPDKSAPKIDIESSLAGEETSTTRYRECKPGGAAELWTIEGGSHLPTFQPAFMPLVFDFWAAHPRP